ncbi:hypothetical protein ACIBEJ_51580 [Nonomuraea sp. NPDC050790]|uniref:hypothetical protein n=1 Tax=Nonomuraea sp. NPDC050790 TaxID=3364371 RepID=UPI0037915CF5
MPERSETDMMSYVLRWNHRRSEPGTPLTEEQARARDAKGEEYTAILPPRPGTRSPILVTLIWRTGVVLATFLDGAGRRGTQYTFMRHDAERLFLSRVYVWIYPDARPGLLLADAVVREEIRFHPDGRARRVVTDKDARTRETVEYTGVAVADHWEPVPTFGSYASIARFERKCA